jgi:hypothetical protein
MIVTDGFEFYKRVVRRIFGSVCLYGQVIKTRRNDRIIKVERRTLIGDTWRFEETLRDSEDSSKLNTSFIERLNLTIRQARPIFFGGRYATLDGRSVSKITWSCFAAITIS